MASLALFVATTALAAPAPSRFELRAAMQSGSAGQRGSGFELHARLMPARTRIEGTGYALDAVAAPAGTCGGGDLIFRDGFDPRDSFLRTRD